jgi:hypothetical protein
VVARLTAPDGWQKTIVVSADGGVRVDYTWDPAWAPDGVFVAELSLGHPAAVQGEPVATPIAYTIETLAKSERGFDRTRQGECLTYVWPGHLGRASLCLTPGPP